MSDIKIQKVKLIKGGEKLEVEFNETGDIKSSTDKTCENPVHQDLKNAVFGLACHLGILCDYITEKRAKDKEELEKFVVTGYSLGGKEDEEGVIITGYRKTPTGKTVTLNTPYLKLDSNPETYYLIGDLNNQIDVIESEVLLYLGGKKGPETQTKMEFPEQEGDPVTNMQVDHPESLYSGDGVQSNGVDKSKKGKGKGKKKVPQSAAAPNGESIDDEEF